MKFIIRGVGFILIREIAIRNRVKDEIFEIFVVVRER